MMDIIGHIRERRDITREELETLLATKEEETVRQLQGRGAVKKISGQHARYLYF